MKAIIEYKRFFAYSEKQKKCFNTIFKPGINLIHGKNTSGKSTLIQAIHYTFGINDEKHKLAEVLDKNVIFRLDFTLKKEDIENISILRDGEFIYIRRENIPILKFSGISANNAIEHIHLKEYISELFGFNLKLESSGEYKLASLEAMFLPYYVAQDYGWVLALKSFRGLDYFKNFKFDYYDYYLGITNEYDRLKKQKIELEKKNLESEIRFLSEREKGKDELQLSKLKDEAYVVKATDYIIKFKENKDELIKLEKDFIEKSNKLTFWEERLKILRKVKNALNNQIPLDSVCPTCNQKLPNSFENIYEHFQDLNDTEKQIEEINSANGLIKDLKSKINALVSDINSQKELVSKDYSLLLEYKIEHLTFNTWLDNKSNVRLSENIISQIGEATVKLSTTIEKLKEFKTEDDLKKERNAKDYVFKSYFEKNLNELKVKAFDEPKYGLLYQMSLFPKQGVELLQTLLAYYFAFNKIIKETSYIHRLPFMLDAIFKEDIEDDNRIIILDFIYKNKPSDNQLIISIADSKNNLKTASDYNRENLNNEANLILINKDNTRSFLSEFKLEYSEYLEETLSIME
ncbi:MAG: hypothetical protein RLZZ175_3147 [Bacteroidota bacterium]|jgi:energy-coupling factor transporter ATP-binding protein EcfA2